MPSRPRAPRSFRMGHRLGRQSLGIGRRAPHLGIHIFTGARVADQCSQAQPIPFDLGIGGQRDLATASEPARHSALGQGGGARRGVVERRQQSRCRRIVAQDLDAERALARRRQRNRGRNDLPDAISQAEALQPGRGHHQRIEIATIQLGQSRVDIAAHCLDHESGKLCSQHQFAPQARGTDAGSGRQFVQRGVLV